MFGISRIRLREVERRLKEVENQLQHVHSELDKTIGWVWMRERPPSITELESRLVNFAFQLGYVWIQESKVGFQKKMASKKPKKC